MKKTKEELFLMKNVIYTLYNKLSQRYGEVFATASDALAERTAHKSLETIRESLDDFELCRVGEIDIETGTVTTEAPRRIQWQIKNDMPLKETKFDETKKTL